MANKAEMIPAYEWICDECGEGNFASMVMMHESDTESGESCGMFLRPERVACRACQAGFGCEYPAMEEVGE